MNELRAQLAPGWSAVNIALIVVLGFFALPLGLLMVGYVLLGNRLGLDFSQPGSVRDFGGRLAHSWRAAADTWRQEPGLSHGSGASAAGTPDWSSTSRADGAPDSATDSATDETLRRERGMLAREREAFESEKRDWRAKAKEATTETQDS